MQQLFIELYNYKQSWGECSADVRKAFAAGVTEAVGQLRSAGVEVIAYGSNSMQTDRRAPYDFFCVYRVPSSESQREFERQVAASGWYDYFDQVNVSGDIVDHETGLRANAELARPRSGQ
jgi:haloalkane dehalogenase